MSSGASHTPAYAAVDLRTCEREPIHVPGAIQPHGVLVALDHASRVVMVSANSGDLLGRAPDEALGASIDDMVGADAGRQVRERLADRVSGESLILRLPADLGGALAGEEVDVSLHRSGARVVVEIESLGRPRSTLLTYQSARGAMARLSAGGSVDELVGQLAREVRTLTSFDRVMVYRFDRQWNGEVVAEERREDLNPFLGLHYPASDIPAQARRLYTVNWTRLIADVAYRPLHLHPVLDPGTGAPLDLTHSTLRSVSPMHLEYLSHMGVTASMSVSLIVDGELWGLVAAHHYSGPHRPSQDARSAAEFLGQVASQQIAEREHADAREDALAAQATLARISARIAAAEESPLRMLIQDPELLSLVGASGAALCFNDVITVRGDVTDEDALRRIAGRLLRPPYGEPVAAESLSELDPALGLVADVAAGALGIGSAPDSWLVWLRPELPQVVDWGGDPSNKELYAGEGDDVRLSPRRSFDLWREVVRGRSAPWNPWRLEVARDLRTFMNALLLQRSREQIAVADSLQRTVLPATVPVFDGIELAVRYESASSYQLGGDWWDAFRLDDERVALVVGDVAGHGVAAVGDMTQARAALRAHLAGGVPPARALDLLDALMVDLLPDQVATAVVVVVNREARTAELTSAGHPPPLLFDGDQVRELVVDARPLLGVGEGVAVSCVVDLPVGATLVLYTDGLLERRGSDLAQSLDGLRRVSERAPRPDRLAEWTDTLLGALPGAGADDTTVLAVHLR